MSKTRSKPVSKPKSKPSSEDESQGQFKCGKCGEPFSKAHGLAIHILRMHKRTWGQGSKNAKPSKPAPATSRATKSLVRMICRKCNRENFTTGAAYAAHCRHCKGIPMAGARPQIPAPYPSVRTLGSGGAPTDIVPMTSNGHGQIEKLKAAAASKRREADEIDKLVASFETCEANAKKYLM